MSPSKLVCIVGPTGVGKTAFAVEYAKKHQAELISADSRQVYIGMDIGTGKDTALGQWIEVNQRKTLSIDGIFIHGLDLVTPDQDFSVSDWLKSTTLLIEEIQQREHQSIIIGGTGFYLDALAGKIDTLGVGPNSQLRQELSLVSTPELQQRLIKLNASRFESMNPSDQANPARLIRAIEVAIDTHHPEFVSGSKTQNPKPITQSVDLLSTVYSLELIGLTMPRRQLLAKVDHRIDQMVANGLVNETKTLLQQYPSNTQAFTSIGYAEIRDYLNHQCTLPQAIQKIKVRTHHYIKRQYTWFNKQSVEWIEV